jgi:hypothetical protein
MVCHSGIAQYDIICYIYVQDKSDQPIRNERTDFPGQGKFFKLECPSTYCRLLREILHNFVTNAPLWTDQAATPKAAARRTTTNYRLDTHIPALIFCQYAVSLCDIPRIKQATLIPFRRKLA